MVFNDTTNKNGIIQEVEFWTELGDGAISGDTTLLKIITARVNEAFARIMPILLTSASTLGWDDTNNTDQPIGTFNIVSGQSDYTIAQDDNSLDILNITNLSIVSSATNTYFMELERMTVDDPRAVFAMSPNPTDVGVPTSYLVRGNTVFLWPQPNYSSTAGAKIFFERKQVVFTSASTTQEPGIPSPFHGLLAMHAAHDWLIVNKPGNAELITRLESEMAKRRLDLTAAIRQRYPTREKLTTAGINFR